jgi:predicted aspartyl protease
MGLFHVKGQLTGPTGNVEEVEFLVDTGATLAQLRGFGRVKGVK